MTFLNPLALLGLAAAAIPLVIHLFNFRRPKRVDFSSLVFLRELEKKTMKRFRLRQWLLLLLRTLALACLALAFARPTLEGDTAARLGGRASSSVVALVDNSRSMEARDAQGGYLEQARELASALTDATEPGDELFVLTTAADDAVEAPFATRTAAAEALAAVGTAPAARPLSETVRDAAEALAEEASHLNREVFVFSDLQASTLTDSLERMEAPSAEGLRVALVPVGERRQANVAVTDVAVQSRVVEAGQPVEVVATLANYGADPVEGYGASVYLEDERVAQGAADLPADGTGEIRFTVTPQRRGWLEGVVETEDDAFASDNLYYFALHVPEQRRILAVRGEGQDARYVQLALSPELARATGAFAVDTIEENELAATPLGTYDAVVLVGPRSLASGERAALAGYVEEGGGVLLFPGTGSQTTDFNALLDELGAGQYGGYSGQLGGGQPVARFDRVETEHPLFEGVLDGGADGRVETPELFYALNYQPGAQAGNEQTLIRLSNGFPFLQEVRHGRGTALLLAVAPDPAWSDLPTRGLFVPLLYRALYYLSAGGDVQGEALTVGEAAELRLAGVDEGAALRLVAPDGDAFAPETRRLFGATLALLDDAPRPSGVYDVRAGDDLARRVAYNLDRRESDLAAMSPEEAAQQLAEATGAEVRVLEADGGDPQAFLTALEEDRVGVELWNVFVLLGLIFLVAESLVARQQRAQPVPA